MSANDDYVGPPIPYGGWSLQLEPVGDDEDGRWLGIVHFGDRRRAQVAISLDQEAMESGRFPLGPIELLVAATTPR